MLEPAEEAVGVDQLVRRLPARTTGGGERAQRIAGRGRAQRRVATAPDELLRLRVELDLADAAPSQLDVVAGDRDRATAGLGVDLPLDRLDVLDGREVEILAPDEGPEMPHHVGADSAVADHRARLDHRGALPVLPVAFVVLLGGQRGQCKRRRTRIGPESEVGPIDGTVVAAVAEQGDEIAHEAMQRFARPAPPPVAYALRIVEHDEGEVARIGELARAQGAHPEHGQPARLGGRAGLRRREDAARCQPVEQMVEGAGKRRLREPRQRRGHRLERPGAGDFGKRSGEPRPSLACPQPLQDGATVGGAAGLDRHLVERALQGSLGAALGHDAKLGRFAGERLRESGTAAEHAVEEVCGAAVAHQGGGERLIGAAARGSGRTPRFPARALGRGRPGMHCVIRKKRQERHRTPIVLQGLQCRTSKGRYTGAAGEAVSASST